MLIAVKCFSFSFRYHVAAADDRFAKFVPGVIRYDEKGNTPSWHSSQTQISLTVPLSVLIHNLVFCFSSWSECSDLFGGVLVESRLMPARFIMSLWLRSQVNKVPHAPFNAVGKFNVLVPP